MSANRTAKKSERTRGRIVGAAVKLFRRNGFEETTMREIASAADTALGSAYYYFSGKDEIVLEIYRHNHEKIIAAVDGIKARHRGFRARLEAYLDTILATFEEQHSFMGVLARSGIDPGNPISPFSAESAPLRREAVESLGDLMRGSDLRTDAGVREQLPLLLWLFQVGVMLFWCFDLSAGRARTRLLIGLSLDVIFQALAIVRLPLAGRLASRTLRLVREFADPLAA